MEEINETHCEIIFQQKKYYTSEMWLLDDGIMTKHVYNTDYDFIGLLQWDKDRPDNIWTIDDSWTIEDNVLFIIFETNICYWYHFPSELLICIAFQKSSQRIYTEEEIEQLKEFQSLVNCVDKSYTSTTIPFNMYFHMKSYFHFNDEREKVLYHKLTEFPYAGVVHIYDPAESVPVLENIALLK